MSLHVNTAGIRNDMCIGENLTVADHSPTAGDLLGPRLGSRTHKVGRPTGRVNLDDCIADLVLSHANCGT